MAFLDRLSPLWRHRDPEVRAAAVRKLGEDARDVLATVARTDGDIRVRRIAVKKIDDPDLLLEIGRIDADEDLRSLAMGRAEELLVERATADTPIEECLRALAAVTRPSHRVTVATRAPHPSVRRAALESIADEPLLAEVARRGDDPAIGLQALERISDVGLLQRIAARDAPSAVALAALARLDDPDRLQAIADDHHAPKSVRKQARVMLAARVGDDHPTRVAARRERQVQLCILAERLSDTTEPAAARTALGAAEHDWRELSAHGELDPRVESRFLLACAVARESITRAEQHREAEERRAEAHRQGLAARQQLCERVEALHGAETPDALAAARAAWQELGLFDDPQSRDLNTRFALALERCAQRYERWRVRDDFRAQLGGLVREAERLAESRNPQGATRPRAVLEQRWARLASSPAGVKWLADERELQRRFAEAGEALTRREQTLHAEHARRERATRAHLTTLCDRLEKLTKQEKMTQAAADRASAAAADADAGLSALPPAEREPLRQRLAAARQALAQRVDAQARAEDWKRWANAELQQQLIERAEALLASGDPRRMLRESGHLDREWKRVAVAPPQHSRRLWDRFRHTRDELRRRCDAHLAENLVKKEALCRAVEPLADSTDWNTTADAIRRMQEEWKQIGPVRQHLSAALFARFRAPANRFFERYEQQRLARKERYEELVTRMRTLCEAAEALAESTDWDVTEAEIRRLRQSAQQVWGRRPANTPPQGRQPRQTDALRHRFEVACDRFFDRHRRRDAVELETKLAALESILIDLDALRLALAGAEVPAAEEVTQRLKDRLAEWRRVGPLPLAHAGVFGRRLQAACDAIEAAYPGGFPDDELEAESNVAQREKLCARFERLAAAVTFAVDEPGDLAESLRLKLATRTIGGTAAPPEEQMRRDAKEAADRLRSKWQRLGPVIGTRARTLAQRFAKADAELTELCGRDPQA